MIILQFKLSVYVCVVQLCVFPGPHVVTFISRLTFCLLNCADCVNLKMGQPAVSEAKESPNGIYITS